MRIREPPCKKKNTSTRMYHQNNISKGYKKNHKCIPSKEAITIVKYTLDTDVHLLINRYTQKLKVKRNIK